MSDDSSERPAASAAVGAAMEGHEPDAPDDGREDGLLSRLKLIEDQPLEARAEAYAHVHDELRDALDAADRQGGR